MSYTKVTCEECSNIDTIVEVDGYQFGDRLLEGVIFEARHNYNTDKWELEPKEKNSPYLQELNLPYWLKIGSEHMAENDLATCTCCGEDVDIYELGLPKDHVEPTPLMIGDIS